MRTDLVGTIGDLVRRQAATYGDRTLWIEDGRSTTYAEYNESTERLASGLRNAGVHAGVRVATYLPNSVTLLEAYTAIAKVGATVVFCHPQFTGRELQYILADAEVSVVLTDTERIPVLDGLRDSCPALRQVMDVNGPEWSELRAAEPTALEEVDPHAEAWIAYTSGTTGSPKGAAMSQHAVTWVAANVVSLLGVHPDDVVLCALPLSHLFALNSCYLQILSAGASAALLPRFSITPVLQAVHDHSVSILPAVPTMLAFLTHSEERAKFETKSLRMVVSGGAVLKEQLYKDVHDAFGVPIRDAWGSTETASFAVFTPGGATSVPGSCGLALPGCAVRIVDPRTGEDVAVGQRGEMLVRGPNLMIEYINKPDATANALRGGWYHTGDLAQFDENGFVYIVDRLKDLIISGGYNIAPKEVEEVILTHPAVMDVAVVGAPDDGLGEIPRAVVILKNGMEATVEEIIDHCRTQMAQYKVPRQVIFRSELPRTGSGKIKRYALKAEVATDGS